MAREAESWEEWDKKIAELIAKDGIPRCFICGETLEICNLQAGLDGFDECEWLAGK